MTMTRDEKSETANRADDGRTGKLLSLNLDLPKAVPEAATPYFLGVSGAGPLLHAGAWG